MKMRWVLFMAVLALVLGFVLVGCSGAKEEAALNDAAPTLDGKALVEERCIQCHDLARVESAAKTPDGWKANVERMVDNGAKLNEAEQQAVIAYLSEAYPE
jgi:mono/diheme cytochrome c family protein